MTLLGVVPGVVLATTLSINPGLFGIIGGFLAATIGAYAVWRKIEPERAKLRSEAERLGNEAQEIEARITTNLLDNMEKDRQRQREVAAHAEAAQAKAEARLAVALAEHSEQLAQWKDMKHRLENDLRAARLEVENLHRKIDTMDEEIKSLKIALAIEQGRRVDDDRMTEIEHRADTAETRADVAEARADKAQTTADRQADRNDDTPGHA